ncbi:cytochrome P450 [Lentinula lateritia]|nr:cytochrome P450 [Lentinula lateritia]
MLQLLPYSISCILVVLTYGIFRKQRFLPPGPRGLPIVGNLFGMPKTEEWLHWSKFKDTYGPISSVRVLTQTIILLNTLDVSQDLLDRRSQIYSNRPILPFAGEMYANSHAVTIGWDHQLILTSDGERHKVMRKMVAQYIGTKTAVAAFSEIQEVEVQWFVSAIMKQPDAILTHIRRATSAVFIKITHGYSIEHEKSDPLINIIETAAREFYIAAAPGSWLVDSMPWLKYLPNWMPGTSFKRVAAQFKETNLKQVYLPIEMVKQDMTKNIAVSCFVTKMLESPKSPLEEEVFPYVATSLYGGGQDTVSAAIGTYFLIMVLYPDVQRKAQEEIDLVLGGCFLPKTKDLENLPYLQAIFKEVIRWHTVACINGPHCTTQDDWYRGYFIPKGSIVLSNLWQIANDPNNYTNPSIFNPERFLGNQPELDPLTFVFGFGRRRCPGIELAQTTCMLMMATSLAVFDILKAKDENGQEITPIPQFISSTICHPKPFSCDIQPRSGEAEALLTDIQCKQNFA